MTILCHTQGAILGSILAKTKHSIIAFAPIIINHFEPVILIYLCITSDPYLLYLKLSH